MKKYKWFDATYKALRSRFRIGFEVEKEEREVEEMLDSIVRYAKDFKDSSKSPIKIIESIDNLKRSI